MKFVKNIAKNAASTGMAAVAGAAGRAIKNQGFAKVPMLKDYPIAHNPILFLLGTMLADSSKMHYAGVGIAAVAGADFIGKFVPMAAAINDDLSEEALQGLEEEMADELEDRLSDDVANVMDAMNGDEDFDGMQDSVSNPQAAMNGM